MSKHLARKAAYFYTHVWDKTFGEALGLYPPHEKATPQRYMRAGVFIKALLKNMKNQNVGTIWRGLSENQARNFEKNGQMTRKTFSSFSRSYTVAEKFADGKVILVIEGRVPAIKYNQKRYKSVYANEDEVLLPPGSFTHNKSHPKTMIRGKTIYYVKFTPIDIHVNIPKTNNTRAQNIMNNRWRQMKIKNIENQMNKIEANSNRISEMFRKETNKKRRNILTDMSNRLNNLHRNLNRRLQRL